MKTNKETNLIVHQPTLSLANPDLPSNLADVDPATGRKIVGYYQEVGVLMAAFGQSGLALGKKLREVREDLKPKELWMLFLRNIPGMSARTADRFINRYEQATHNFKHAPKVLEMAVAGGIDLGGEDKRRPFGRYTRAVRIVGPAPKPTGDEEKDVKEAREWLQAVKQKAAVNQRREKVDPIDRAAAFLIRAVERKPEEERGIFLTAVIKGAMKVLGIKEVLPLSQRAKAA